MPIDPSIVLGTRVPQFQQPDPLDNYAKIMAIQGAQGQQALHGFQLQEARDAADSSSRLKALFGANPNATPEQVMAIDPKTGMALQKSKLDAEKTRTDIDKSKAEIPKIQQEALVKATAAHRDQLSNVNDPQSAAQWVAAGYNDPILAPVFSRTGTADQAIAKIPQDPAAFQQWKQENALGATKFIELNKPNIHMQDTGGASQVVAVPGLGGAPSVLSTTPKTQSPDSAATDTRVASEGALNRGVTVRGQNLTDARAREANGVLAGGELTPEAETMAQAIAAGKLAPLSGFALNKPGGRALMGRVMQINPEYSGKDFGTGAKAEKDFATGKQGNSVRSFNVALSHLDTLDQLSDALHNKDTQAINRIGNYVATQTGSAAPTSFDAAKKIVADEIVKAIVGSGGGVADREEAARTISAASSPAQLKGVINTYKDLMKGQLGGLRQQYETSTGRKDFERFLSPAGMKAEGAAPVIKTEGDAFEDAQKAKRAIAAGADPAAVKARYKERTGREL